MAKKKTYTKKYKKFKRYKNVGFNRYFRSMLQTTLTAEFSYTNNQLHFGMYNGNIATNYGQTVSVLMQDCPTWPTYGNLFSQFKLRGISITATPNGKNTDAAYPGAVKIGLVNQNAGYDWNLVKDANYGMVLNPLGKTKCWIPFIGSGVGWIRVGLPTDQPGAIHIGRSVDNIFPVEPMYWSLEFKFYVTFKQSLY